MKRLLQDVTRQIETGKRQGTVETLSAIARSLDVPLDVLTD